MRPAALREAVLATAAALAGEAPPEPAEALDRTEMRAALRPDEAGPNASLALRYRDLGDPLWLECAAACLDRRPELASDVEPRGDLATAMRTDLEPATRYAAAARAEGRLVPAAQLSLWRHVLASTSDCEQAARVAEAVRADLEAASTSLSSFSLAHRRGLGHALRGLGAPLLGALAEAGAVLRGVERFEVDLEVATLTLDRRAASELVATGLRRAELLPQLGAEERRRTGRRWIAATARAAEALATVCGPGEAAEPLARCVAMLHREPANRADAGLPLAALVAVHGRLGLLDEAVRLAVEGADGWVATLTALDHLGGCWPHWPPVTVANRLELLLALPLPAELAAWRDACVVGHVAAAGARPKAVAMAQLIELPWARAVGLGRAGAGPESFDAEARSAGPVEYALAAVARLPIEALPGAVAELCGALGPIQADRLRCRCALRAAEPPEELVQAVGEPVLAALASAARAASRGDAPALARIRRRLPATHDLWARPIDLGLSPPGVWSELALGLAAEPFAELAAHLPQAGDDPATLPLLLLAWLRRRAEAWVAGQARAYHAAVLLRAAEPTPFAGRAADAGAEQPDVRRDREDP